VIAGDPDRGSFGARHHVGAKAQGLNFRADRGNILLTGVRAHDN
jgi:hypothetical protein